VEYLKTTRDSAITMLQDLWGQMRHLGNIPKDPTSESRKPSDLPIRLTEENYRFHKTDGGDGTQQCEENVLHGGNNVPAVEDAKKGNLIPRPPMRPNSPRVATARSISRYNDTPKLRVRNWLVDSGSGLDLISRKDASECLGFIIRGINVELATANGQTSSDEVLPLVIKRLNEAISPHVLEDTPNVLSLGRRIIEDGYSFHWLAYSTQPWLEHPTTGDVIVLEVKDFVPYLKVPLGDAVPQQHGTADGQPIAASALTPTTTGEKHAPDSEGNAFANGEEGQAPPVDTNQAVEQKRRDLKAEAKSLKHQLTHTPHNPYCPSCVRAKLTRQPARRTRQDPKKLPKKFGDLVNADHIIANSDEAAGLTGERDALLIVDRYSGYIDAFPLGSKTAEDAYGAFAEYFGSERPVDVYVWSDSAKELKRALLDLRIPHGRATPGRHQANGFCERSVRKVVDGARAALEHAGLPACFWVFAIRHWCFQTNVDIIDGESAWNLRHEKGHFTGPLLPFGCTVDFLSKPEVVNALPKFEPRSSVGIFVGYHLQPGGHWKR